MVGVGRFSQDPSGLGVGQVACVALNVRLFTLTVMEFIGSSLICFLSLGCPVNIEKSIFLPEFESNSVCNFRILLPYS